jgi:hypothetical protein
MVRYWKRISETVRAALASAHRVCVIGQSNRLWRKQVRQTFAPIGRDSDQGGFQPTSNARNEAMLQECIVFSGHLVKMEKDMLAVQKQSSSE